MDTMSQGFPDLHIGRKVEHPELGEGVVYDFEPTGMSASSFRPANDK
ncbi:MAG: hypothetical protein V9G14_16985 [Cypionkella sp.]